MPMLRSFWLSTKKGKEAWADPILDRKAGTVRFAIRFKGTPPEETSNRTMARCLFCGSIMKKGELRKSASEHGMAEIPLAIVAEGRHGRIYLESTATDLPKVAKPIVAELTQLITDDKRWFSPPQYGLPTFADLFTPRQLTALTTFSDLVGEARAKVLADARAAWEGVEGLKDVIEGRKDGIEGRKDVVEGLKDVVEGRKDVVEGLKDVVEGLKDVVEGRKDVVEGRMDVVEGLKDVIEGRKDVVEGLKDVIEGRKDGIEGRKDGIESLKDGVKPLGAGEMAAAEGLAGLSDDTRPLADGGSGPQAYADAVATYLAFVVDKLADLGNSLNRWEPNAQCPRQLFARQAMPMVWDFAEGNPFSESSGSWSVLFRNLHGAFESPLFDFERPKEADARQANVTEDATYAIERVAQRDATDETTYAMVPIISCDPPYYDNIGYADLSDFFYVWLRRTLKEVYPDLLGTMLTPKSEEMIASPYRHGGSKAKAAAFFEDGLGSAIGQWRQHGCADYPTTIFYAFKQSETDDAGTASTGWETFLSGVIGHGFSITGTWPIRTECGSRMVGQGTNALASSVVLACVPRAENAPAATRREFLNSLKAELPEAMRKLQSGNIAPVDLAQAAIGPGMGVFSRYSKVLEADGSAMGVRGALVLINQMLDEVLAEQEGEFDADTRWALAWFEQFGMNEGPYGQAETLSKAKNTSVQGLAEAGVVMARSGKVKLMGREAMPGDWDPATDKHPTTWEATQHLIRKLQEQGEAAAGQLLAKLSGDRAEQARDLAYRLYHVAERKGWAGEATAYNGLVVAWLEISKLARGQETGGRRQEMGALFG
jgi:adenine-specific DNA methylase